MREEIYNQSTTAVATKTEKSQNIIDLSMPTENPRHFPKEEEMQKVVPLHLLVKT